MEIFYFFSSSCYSNHVHTGGRSFTSSHHLHWIPQVDQIGAMFFPFYKFWFNFLICWNRLTTGKLSIHGRYLQVSTALLFLLATIPLLSPTTAPLISLVQVNNCRGRCPPPLPSCHHPPSLAHHRAAHLFSSGKQLQRALSPSSSFLPPSPFSSPPPRCSSL